MYTKKDYISIEECCQQYQIEIAFVQQLNASGLIQMTSINEQQFLLLDHLSQLERFIRLHYDLEVNVEGIDIIASLLARIEDLQEEVVKLREIGDNKI